MDDVLGRKGEALPTLASEDGVPRAPLLGEKNITLLVIADKLASGLGLTLAGLLLEMERGSGTTEDE